MKDNNENNSENKQKVKTITIKEIKSFLWNKGFFIKGFNDSGIRNYKIWDLKAKEIIAIVGINRLRDFYNKYYFNEY